jgi:hypothetical protein
MLAAADSSVISSGDDDIPISSCIIKPLSPRHGTTVIPEATSHVTRAGTSAVQKL